MLKGALPGHVVELPTLLASESIKLGGRELKVKRPGALSSPGRFLRRLLSCFYGPLRQASRIL
ncbi:hypothetical protein SMG44B_20812 [Stenotrophomonas maltophilia]